MRRALLALALLAATPVSAEKLASTVSSSTISITSSFDGAVVSLFGTIQSDVHGIAAQAERNERIPGLIALYSVLAAEATDAEHPAHDYFLGRYTTMRETYRTEFAALAEEGRLRDGVDPALAAATVVALWEGIQLQWLYSPERIHAAEALRGYLELIILPARSQNSTATRNSTAT